MGETRRSDVASGGQWTKRCAVGYLRGARARLASARRAGMPAWIGREDFGVPGSVEPSAGKLRGSACPPPSSTTSNAAVAAHVV
jgi:hypothetical protein